jgi:signal transduction histidine kinase
MTPPASGVADVEVKLAGRPHDAVAPVLNGTGPRPSAPDPVVATTSWPGRLARAARARLSGVPRTDPVQPDPGMAEAGAAPPTRRQRLGWPPWRTLMGQFFLVSAAVLLLSMLAQGTWIALTIEQQARHHAGSAAALFIDHFIAPQLQDIDPTVTLPAEDRRAIDRVMQQVAAPMEVVALKIWNTDGLVLYATNRAIVGRRFVPSAALLLAAAGTMSAEFDRLEDVESGWERDLGVPLLEVYVPVRDGAGRVFAVVEFYADGQAVRDQIASATLRAWLVTGLACLVMIAALSVIFGRAVNVIDHQRHALVRRMREVSRALSQNRTLQDRVERASRLAAEENERYLLSLGADLHDGPAQLIGYALLRLDALDPGPQGSAAPSSASTEIAAIRSALTDAMTDVRNICAGLSMPEIEALTLAEALLTTIRDHEQRTRTVVRRTLSSGLPLATPHFIKVCVCRFVQEGLNNAVRHAGGRGQRVDAWAEGHIVYVKVEDTGPGMAAAALGGNRAQLGLAGLCHRIESWGGTIHVASTPGEGTRLTAAMPIVMEQEGASP